MGRLMGRKLLPLGVGPCVLTLKTLNFFDCDAVKTDWVNSVRLSGTWEQIEQKLRSTPGVGRIATGPEEKQIMEELRSAYRPLPKRTRKG